MYWLEFKDLIENGVMPWWRSDSCVWMLIAEDELSYGVSSTFTIFDISFYHNYGEKQQLYYFSIKIAWRWILEISWESFDLTIFWWTSNRVINYGSLVCLHTKQIVRICRYILNVSTCRFNNNFVHSPFNHVSCSFLKVGNQFTTQVIYGNLRCNFSKI